MIRHVFFDAGATLISPHPSMGEIYARTLRPLGIDATPREFTREFSRAWDEMSEEVGTGRDRFSSYPGGERGYWREFVGRVLARIDGHSDVTRATSALHRAFADPAAWSVFPDVAETLAELQRRGVRLGVISNWDSRLPALLEALGLAGAFDPIVFSAGVGEEKPSAGIFREALDRAGARAEESAHVGDDLQADVLGAEAAGLAGVLLARDGPPPPGVRAVTTLRELPAALGMDGSGREGP